MVTVAVKAKMSEGLVEIFMENQILLTRPSNEAMNPMTVGDEYSTAEYLTKIDHGRRGDRAI